jgi:hypothetical protein
MRNRFIGTEIDITLLTPGAWTNQEDLIGRAKVAGETL